MSTGDVSLDWCEHPRAKVSRPRSRLLKNGSVKFWRQCLICGAAIAPQCSRAKTMEWTGGNPAQFDEELPKQYRAVQERIRTEKKQEWQAWYAEYLQSCQWREIRYHVLERCGHLCEGCRIDTATVVHHLSYEHVGRELLFELVGLCQNCHDRAHRTGDQSRPFLSFS